MDEGQSYSPPRTASACWLSSTLLGTGVALEYHGQELKHLGRGKQSEVWLEKELRVSWKAREVEARVKWCPDNL